MPDHMSQYDYSQQFAERDPNPLVHLQFPATPPRDCHGTHRSSYGVHTVQPVVVGNGPSEADSYNVHQRRNGSAYRGSNKRHRDRRPQDKGALHPVNIGWQPRAETMPSQDWFDPHQVHEEHVSQNISHRNGVSAHNVVGTVGTEADVDNEWYMVSLVAATDDMNMYNNEQESHHRRADSGIDMSLAPRSKSRARAGHRSARATGQQADDVVYGVGGAFAGGSSWSPR